MSVTDIRRLKDQALSDSRWSRDELLGLIRDGAGSRVSDEELPVLKESLDAALNGIVEGRVRLDDLDPTALNGLAPRTRAFVEKLMGSETFARTYQYRSQLDSLKDPRTPGSIPFWQAIVADAKPRLERLREQKMDPARETQTMAGTKIPGETKDFIRACEGHGATPYDARSVEGDIAWDGDHDVFHARGIYNPYVQDLDGTESARDPMNWKNTEINPTRLIEERNTSQNYDMMTENTVSIHGNSWMTYRQTQGTWSGHLGNRYDEAFHVSLFARDSEGAPWAGNFALLGPDASLHLVPAARHTTQSHVLPEAPEGPEFSAIGVRWADQTGVDPRGNGQVHVLTTNSLGRGMDMWAMGHLRFGPTTLANGTASAELTYMAISGRLGRAIAEEGLIIPNPVEIARRNGVPIAADVEQSLLDEVQQQYRDLIWLNPDTNCIQRKP